MKTTLKYIAVIVSILIALALTNMTADFNNPVYLLMSIVFVASTIYAVTNN